MATRAFLLCSDEKAVQAVTQILDELEVSFEHSSEPGFSLKRLATQRFDLLIVDCDNAQNATQVFNSARSSNLNKTSIAIAIVEGKAGVPNAFRLGASLVLTKPVSLEQARNTLRTGIGMTRKEAQEVKPPVLASNLHPTAPIPQTVVPPASIVPPAPLPAATTPVAPVRPPAAPVVLTPVAPPAPPAPKVVLETPKPAITPPPIVEKAAAPRPAVVPALPQPMASKPAIPSQSETKEAPSGGTPPVVKAVAAAAGTTPSTSKNFDSVFATPVMSEVKAKNNVSKIDASKTVAEKAEDSGGPALKIVDPLAEEDVLDPVKDHGVPSFGSLGEESFAGMGEKKSGGGKGLLIAAIVLVLIGGGGYAAWLTQPEFHKFVAWEYLNGMSKITAFRGQPQTAAVKPAPAPAPVAQTPAPVQLVDTTAASGGVTDPAAPIGNNPATSTTAAASQPAGTVPSTDATASKAVTVQPAKQDTTGNHPTNPALVPASLPATPVAKAPSSELLEVPEDFADDQIVHRVHPTYPKQARARKLHGTVVLEAIVNKRGAVDSLQLVSGDPLLAQAAADAVKQWKYKPYFHNNEPTDFQTRITIDFKLP